MESTAAGQLLDEKKKGEERPKHGPKKRQGEHAAWRREVTGADWPSPHLMPGRPSVAPHTAPQGGPAMSLSYTGAGMRRITGQCQAASPGTRALRKGEEAVVSERQREGKKNQRGERWRKWLRFRGKDG